jgi:hypothetical protein
MRALDTSNGLKWTAIEVEEFEVSVPGGKRVTFQPKALVLAAGEGNQVLLDKMAGENRTLRTRGALRTRGGEPAVTTIIKTLRHIQADNKAPAYLRRRADRVLAYLGE